MVVVVVGVTTVQTVVVVDGIIVSAKKTVQNQRQHLCVGFSVCLFVFD